jgi:hypothetical protein
MLCSVMFGTNNHGVMGTDVPVNGLSYFPEHSIKYLSISVRSYVCPSEVMKKHPRQLVHFHCQGSLEGQVCQILTNETERCNGPPTGWEQDWSIFAIWNINTCH